MIEHIPETVTSALLYFHSADNSSEEIKPFLSQLINELPNTYIWAEDGFISGSPLMKDGTYYGKALKRYWFMFPMQDNSTPGSFEKNAEAMGASLLSGGACINYLVDQIKTRFKLQTKKIVLAGFQHGSCLALTASMMRKDDPFEYAILFEPYILESYYLKNEYIQQNTTVVCIDNEHIRKRIKNWINIETDMEFQKYGIKIMDITVKNGNDNLDNNMIREAIKIIKKL